MPLYDYKCASCAQTTERLQRMDAPPPSCTSCARPMQRQISRTSFRLKGYSWSANGYGDRPAGEAPRATDD